MAACEAALESAWGNSELAVQDNNLFGMKQHQHPIYGTAALPTREYLSGEWKVVNALWIHYPGWATCFADRMITLTRLAPQLPHYAAALKATNAEAYIVEVSKSWATDPARASKVSAIYSNYIKDGERHSEAVNQITAAPGQLPAQVQPEGPSRGDEASPTPNQTGEK